jgi:hypothetical protein
MPHARPWEKINFKHMKTNKETGNDDGHLRLIDKIRGCVRFLVSDVLRLAGIEKSNSLAS